MDRIRLEFSWKQGAEGRLDHLVHNGHQIVGFKETRREQGLVAEYEVPSSPAHRARGRLLFLQQKFLGMSCTMAVNGDARAIDDSAQEEHQWDFDGTW